MKTFCPEDTLYTIIERYPETIPVFVSNGFPQMSDQEKREKFAKTISLESALMLKQLDLQIFSKLLNEAIEQKKSSVDATLNQAEQKEDDEALNVVGLLPCPVRLPLLEQFNEFNESYKKSHSIHINHELKAASMGLDWVQENIDGVEDPEKLPDLFISAGFDMFFDEQKIGKFKKDGVFEDTSGLDSFNSLFNDLNLKDPRGHYGMIGVVPAVFLINTDELGDRPVPQSWEDVLAPEFEKRVSLPVGDFDLFNAILLNIHKNYGDEGLRKMGRSLLTAMHPSQMVKSNRSKNTKPIVTIMPYFFTKMVREGGGMQAVWPSDGAILSPIFMLAKKQKIEKLQPVIDFFASKNVGEVLAHSGLFPSVHPDVDNRIEKDKTFMWLGWDYIYSQDIATLINHCETVFNDSVDMTREAV
ncbi:ABC transporter substrate-binding protein [Oceanispirochaeta crateris]|uniref:ABC transporter substrate-binding protein n=1 Tax=Oceanispirochaeta crateris TaxID=2518645 RepID=A0A5C1QQA2_9SPIO|nr:ABC transporter substrate-binding protein [Oceanispirochaeta crateris]QEN08794.1 ABC transporter substrate-binding protein [Oceanispirochaeta crateris]